MSVGRLSVLVVRVVPARLLAGFVSVCVCAVVLGLVPSSAWANLELAGSFGQRAQEVIGMAVNDRTGEVYVALPGNNYRSNDGASVQVFSAEGVFLEAWGYGVAEVKHRVPTPPKTEKEPEKHEEERLHREEAEKEEAQEQDRLDKEFERCGPAAPYPACKSGDVGVEGQGVGQFGNPVGVAVDQATGNVYVLNEYPYGAEPVANDAVLEFSSKGELIASFGEDARFHQEEGPEKIYSTEPNPIAVDALGDVYIANESRVMIFRPEPGSEYKKYAYAGQSEDVIQPDKMPAAEVAVDDAGDLYVNSDTFVAKYAAGDFGSPECVTPVQGNVRGMVVDPASGDFYLYNEALNSFYEFNASCERIADSEFPGVENESANPQAFAFNPVVRFDGRPAGALYVADNRESAKNYIDLVFAAPFPVVPSVGGEFVSGVGSVSATLNASVDPRGSNTRFRFEYGLGDCADGGCVEAPVGGGELGSGESDLTASVGVSGLSPDTVYHYRVIVSSFCNPEVLSEECVAEGSEQTFSTVSPPVGAPGLPDGRVYELVSPVFTDGGEVFTIAPGWDTPSSCENGECEPGDYSVPFPRMVSGDGDAVAYEGKAFAQTGDALDENEYLSTRTATGWQTRALSPQTQQKGTGSGYQLLSSDLSSGVLANEGTPLSTGGLNGYEDLYVQNTSSGSLSAVLSSAPEHRDSSSFKLGFAGASGDMSHVIFEANDALATPGTLDAPAAIDGGAGENNLYEWVDGNVGLVNVLPDGATEPNAAFGSGVLLSGSQNKVPDVNGAISANGSRVYWTDLNTGRVYVRLDERSTVEVPDPSRFLAANTDGSLVLMSDGYLYELHETAGGEGEFEAVSSLGEGLPGFQGILGSSENFSTVYFADTSVLPGALPSGEGRVPVEGEDNLYEWREGVSTFVAALVGDDSMQEIGFGVTAGDWVAAPVARTAQSTPDGQYLAFMSSTPLTGYDNTIVSGICGDSKTGTSTCSEVFEYDSANERLVCASCNPTGAKPLGDSKLPLQVTEGNGAVPQPRALSDNGRVFFDSLDALSPYDTNGNVEDVYEWEPDGLGTCTEAKGCIFMISSGNSPSPSSFLGADPEGNNVFFTTRERLVPEAQGELTKLYDARIEGGFPAVTPPQCTGAGCQGIPNAPPIFATPSSVTFNGVGNFTEGQQTTTPPAKPKPKTKTVKKKKQQRRVKEGLDARCSGHNGEEIKQNTPITGCPKAKHKNIRKAKKRKGSAKHGKKK